MKSGPWGAIERKLAEWIGLDTTTVGTNLIARAVSLRMVELGLTDVAAYVSLLNRSAAERAELIEEVVIPESWFFRDTTPFRVLREHARAGWLSRPTRAPLRVLSIPCASGEEPYSIAIALFEIGLNSSQFVLDGVDISSRRIEQARRGIYSSNAFRGDETAIRDLYFRKVPQGFELDPKIRARVRFLQASILDPALLKDEPRYDVLFCRNLLIYLNEASRHIVVAAIDRLLAPDGLLIVGHADRLGRSKGGLDFTPVGDRGDFAYRRSQAPAPPAWPAALPALSPLALARQSLPSPSSHSTASPATSAKPGGTDPPPGRSRPPSEPQAPGPTVSMVAAVSAAVAGGSLLERASALANGGKHEEAIKVCQDSIKRQGPSSAAYYLMGMIYGSMEDAARADECLSRAVYLDPTHDEALLALALNAERRGDAVAAAGFRRRAERAALRKGAH